MTEKRYYSVDYDEQYYIFDSDVIRKGRVEEEAEYSYDIFADSMGSDEVVNKLNELSEENEELKELRDYFERKKYEYHNKWNLAHLDNINLRKENEQLKQDRDEMFIRERDARNELRDIKIENEKLKGEVKRLKCINKQLEDRLGRDIALNMDCVEAIEDWENECKRCYGSK